MKTNEIIVYCTIAGKEIQAHVKQTMPLSTQYHVFIDQKMEAIATYAGRQWQVFPHDNSWLKGEDCSALAKAIGDSHYPQEFQSV